ncbi:class I SAM-dependent methyltransferase [Sphingomonas sp. 3-13AW]|uniref:class I SAM-dependent methyltransferase n=1 Tax=Sphingomonas sp. 3-13AW TaxID=3050450 RepID=UPI003BB66A3A
MRFLNKAVLDDINQGRPLSINLGCGQRPKPGFYGVDIVEMDGVDIVADLNEGLSQFPDNSVGEIVTQHVLEHVREFMPLMREIHRIVRPGGKVSITVPHYSNVFGFSDPTHVRFFGLYTMFYFVDTADQPNRKLPVFYTDTRFKIDSIFINFYRDGLFDKVMGKIMSILVNRNIGWQHFYEHRLSSLYHADEITYVMRPVK